MYLAPSVLLSGACCWWRVVWAWPSSPGSSPSPPPGTTPHPPPPVLKHMPIHCLQHTPTSIHCLQHTPTSPYVYIPFTGLFATATSRYGVTGTPFPSPYRPPCIGIRTYPLHLLSPSLPFRFLTPPPPPPASAGYASNSLFDYQSDPYAIHRTEPHIPTHVSLTHTSLHIYLALLCV